MARTTFSGPVRAGYQGGSAGPQQPLTPTTINTGEVIEVSQGTGAYGFYSRVEPTVGFGSSSYQTPGEAYGMFGRTQTGAPFATFPSTNFNHMAGVVGNFAVIGTYSNNGLMAGVMGIINTNTLSGDAAVMAFMAGDSGVTTARAAFGVAMAQTTGGSGFEYGIDLKMQDPIFEGGGPSGVIPYTKANIRMEDDVVVMVNTGVPTDGTTGDNFAGPGSMYIDSTAANLYIQTGLITSPVWKLVTRAA
tara:strand:- start:586 stop:1326 length:741 start_codon:yes stop_codon:yes gene_type:complete